ncbi:MAG: wax ester/triacylglycerol synthase domain-containing protein [Acidimicrobiales bacterium]
MVTEVPLDDRSRPGAPGTDRDRRPPRPGPRLGRGPGEGRAAHCPRATPPGQGSVAFDPELPLWESVLVTGLVHDHTTFILKIHHSVIDGIAGIGHLVHLLDLERGQRGMSSLDPAAAGARLGDRSAPRGSDPDSSARSGSAHLGRAPVHRDQHRHVSLDRWRCPGRLHARRLRGDRFVRAYRTTVSTG